MTELAATPKILTVDDIDLRTLMHRIGRSSWAPGPTTEPPERPESDSPIEVLDDEPAAVTADPAAIGAFVDGTQSIITLTWRQHRPIHLLFIAAGAIGANGRPLALREACGVTCSALDTEWVVDLGGNIPVWEVDESSPFEIERAAAQQLGARRETMERAIVDELLDMEGSDAIVVDGSLVGRPNSSRLMGLVKSTGTKYLPDESVLFGLPPGWRSPRFKIGASNKGPGRYSCYLRLFDASEGAWNHALVRVESFSLDNLESFCARALVERQHAGSGDRRWDRHLGGVRATEEFLKGRRPAVFN